MSFAESLANVAVGYLLACGTQLLVFPAFGLTVSVGQTLGLGLVFTLISVVRSFALRRLFESLRVRRSLKRQRSPVAAIAAPGGPYARPRFRAL